MPVDEWDTSQTERGQRSRELVARFTSLPIGGSMVLHGRRRDLDELREIFDRDWSGAYEWQPGLDSPDPVGICADRVVKHAASMLPRVLADAMAVSGDASEAGRAGAAWRLRPSGRQLDSNVINLTPGDRVAAPSGSDLDVLMLVLHGGGELITEIGPVSLAVGQLVWLPRGSARTIAAADSGLSYLTVHVRRPPMSIGLTPPAASST